MAITPYVIIAQDPLYSAVINQNFNFPTSGYFLLMKQKKGTVTVGGVAMTELNTLGDANGASLYGLYVTAGTKNMTYSIASYSSHGILFGKAKGTLARNTGTNKTPSLTVTKGHLVTQLTYGTMAEGRTYTTHYTPPSGFTELSDTGSLGLGGDWWHGGSSSYKINTGTGTIGLTYGSVADTYLYSFNVELEELVSGGSNVIWWFKKLVEKRRRLCHYPLLSPI